MTDTLDKLNSLNAEQLAKVFKLIDKLAAKNTDKAPLLLDNYVAVQHIPAPVRVQRPAQAQAGRQPAPTHQIKPGNGAGVNSTSLERKVGASNGQKRKSKPAARRGQGKPKKTFARREPMNLSGNRPNLFDEVQDKSALHMDDAAIDKKLAVAPRVPRRPPVEYIEVECSVCGYLYEVHPNLVLRTDEGLTFTCNDCTRTSR